MRHGRRVLLAAQHAPGAGAAQRVPVPKPHHVQQVRGDVAGIGAAEGGFVAIEHGFER